MKRKSDRDFEYPTDSVNIGLFPLYEVPLEATFGCQASTLGLVVLYGLYAPLVPVRFSTYGWRNALHE